MRGNCLIHTNLASIVTMNFIHASLVIVAISKPPKKFQLFPMTKERKKKFSPGAGILAQNGHAELDAKLSSSPLPARDPCSSIPSTYLCTYLNAL